MASERVDPRRAPDGPSSAPGPDEQQHVGAAAQTSASSCARRAPPPSSRPSVRMTSPRSRGACRWRRLGAALVCARSSAARATSWAVSSSSTMQRRPAPSADRDELAPGVASLGPRSNAWRARPPARCLVAGQRGRGGPPSPRSWRISGPRKICSDPLGSRPRLEGGVGDGRRGARNARSAGVEPGEHAARSLRVRELSARGRQSWRSYARRRDASNCGRLAPSS